MASYTPKRIRPLRLIAGFFRMLAELMRLWFLVLILVALISPIGPHMRLVFTYEQRGSVNVMLECTYVGTRGLVQYMRGGECPFFVLLDHPK